MHIEENNEHSEFRRKVYSKMYHSSISQIKHDQEKPRKRIVLTEKKCGLREEFKKTFLPLLIDIFELRQIARNFKSEKKENFLLPPRKLQKSPTEIISRLETLQNDIEETKRWCEGVILQISKGIQEAKEALQFIDNSTEIEKLDTPKVPGKPSLGKRFLDFFKRKK